MKHSDYMNLTRRLAFLTREANRTRALLTMPVVVTPDGAIVATREPDQDGAVEVPTNRTGIWMAVVQVDTDVANLMDGLVDGFVEVNQERADQGHGATADVRALYEAMAGFLVATESPVEGLGVLYANTRSTVRAWMDHVTTWFPDLNHQDQADTTNRVTREPATIDKDKLMAFFNGGFKKPDPATGLVPFDMFYNALSSGAVNFTITDFCRIAHQVWTCRHVVRMYKQPQMTFAKFTRMFLGACGVPSPADIAPSRYKTTTDKTDFSTWLE